jgi:hypothetical protein
MTKGLVFPIGFWMAVNAGLSQRFPPLIYGIHAAKTGSAMWLANWLALFVQTVFVVASYWTATTLAWLVAWHTREMEWNPRELTGGMIVWTVLLLPISLLLVHFCGLAGFGLAAALWLERALAEFLALGNPRERMVNPIYSRALEKIRVGKYAAAEKEVLRQLEKCDTDFAGWMLLAELYAYRFQDLEEAERLVHQVCRQTDITRSQMCDALHRLADWQLKAGGDKAAARRSLELICEAFPGTHYGDVARQRINRLRGPRNAG